MKGASAILLLALWPWGALAIEVPPGAVASVEIREASSSAAIPVGPLASGHVPLRVVEGAVTRRAWRLRRPGIGTLDVLAPLRATALAQGFRPLLDCADRACGGFDFRYAIDVLPEPEMHVDLTDFRVFSAVREAGGTQALFLLVSRDSTGAFLQIVEVTPPDALSDAPAAPPETPAPADPSPAPLGSGLAKMLERDGSVVLSGVDFPSGGADLPPRDRAALRELAAALAARPKQRVMLVGHTDASGSLAANMALSLRRAQSVRARLIADHAIAPGRLVAEGAGPLAPRASNLTPQGRILNRRVEAVAIP